jgi:hypothetical protein
MTVSTGKNSNKFLKSSSFREVKFSADNRPLENKKVHNSWSNI